MSTVGGGVNIVRDGLVMYLDASNTKSLADVPSQNLILQSQNFSSTSWVKNNISVTANQSVSPSGLQDADLVDDGVVTNTQHWLYQTPTFVYNTTYTLSIFAKYISRKYMTINIYNGVTSQYVVYDILNGVVYGTTGDVTASIQSYGNSWYRLSYTRTIAATGSPNFRIAMADDFGSETYTGSNKQVYLYGAQFEVGPVATTYIPTTTVPVSRTPTWVDLSKGGNNGTLTGGLTYNYSNGGGLVFNGTSTYVQVPFTPLGINATWTMSSWFKAGTQTIDNGIICFGFLPVIILRTDGNIRTLWYNGVTYPEIRTSGENYSNNVPHNVTVTYDGVTVKLYVDSILKNSNVSNVYALYNSIRLGIEFNNGNKILNGIIYSGLVYTKALSASEVLQNFNTTKSKFGLL